MKSVKSFYQLTFDPENTSINAISKKNEKTSFNYQFCSAWGFIVELLWKQVI